jgi:hypothetical protein
MPVNALWQYLAERVEILSTNTFPELPFENGTLIPTIADLPPGKDQVNAIFLGGSIGPEAILLAPGASDIPLTPVSFTTDQVPVIMAAKGYSVQWQESRTLEAFTGVAGGKDLEELVEDTKIDAVRFGIASRLNRYAVYGEPVLGPAHTGLYNNPNVGVTSSSFNPNTATYSEWVSFLVDILLSSGLSNDGETVMPPTTILMSQRALIRAAQVFNPQNGLISVLEAVRTQIVLPGNINRTVEFVQSPWSNAQMLERFGIFAPGTNKDRMVVYTKDKSVLRRRIEDPVVQLVDERFLAPTQALTRIYPYFSCSSVTFILNPTGIRYIDTPRAL